MIRFLLLTAFGGLSTFGGQALLSLGLHPERIVPLTLVVEGCAAVAVGAALFVTGMLGLAEAFEKQSLRLFQLLQTRQAPNSDSELADTQGLPIGGPADLASNSERFWHGYLRSTGGLCLALGGLLALVLILGDINYETYRATLGAGLAAIALPTIVLWIGGMAKIWRSHRDVLIWAVRAESLPEKRAEVVEIHQRRPTREAVFRSTRPAALCREARAVA